VRSGMNIPPVVPGPDVRRGLTGFGGSRRLLLAVDSLEAH
jgi:hypothetical protein